MTNKKKNTSTAEGGSREEEASKHKKSRRITVNSNETTEGFPAETESERNEEPPREPKTLEEAISSVCGNGAEKISEGCSLRFRPGDSNDVNALVSLYDQTANDTSEDSSSPPRPKNTKRKTSSGSLDEASLESRLSASLGDEDRPPSVFPLCADATNVDGDDDDKPKLVAAALLSVGWDKFLSPALRVEWCGFDPDMNATTAGEIQRSVWLLISVIAAKIGCKEILTPPRS